MIERDGVAGVTHRTVAAEAGVPTTSTTYHFATLDDLLSGALVWSAEQCASEVYWMIDRARTKGSRGVNELAELLADWLGPRRRRAIAEYELYLLAARRPELRPAARRWLDVLTSMVRQPGDESGVQLRTYLAGVDGLLMQGLIDDEPPTAEQLRPVVRFMFRDLG
ncbi:TetR family transcriptional regulator [Herbihabitans rhizosphaerae]|uniref:TetR family transcriptional regulator n=1 Tax=Herbihabitans rhizosphaerae TaxID=1872711 RepID=A0A4Q7KPD4_9PSEU|nr:TetR family transcriptional regulator [Herbihabitans rhizosphaerae]